MRDEATNFNESFDYKYILTILAGGLIGVLFRYFINSAFKFWIKTEFFWSTAVINIIGSIAIGIIYVTTRDNYNIHEYIVLGLTTGFLGGFTTFSGYCLDTIKLINNNRIVLALCYSLFTPVISIGTIAITIAVSNKLNQSNS